MSVLRIFLFGNVRVRHDQRQDEIKLTRTIQLLLAYLLLERNRMHPREFLMDLFWSDHSQESARNCLNTALWRLRKALEPEIETHGRYLVSSDNGDVGFNIACDCWLDVAIFEELVNWVLKEPLDRVTGEQIQELEDGVTLYTGDLLESVYEDWALAPREHKRQLYLDSLIYLMRYYHMYGNIVRGIEYGKKILRIDPLREEVHRTLMKLYMDSGQRSLAVRQYKACRQSLLTELGIQPMEETQALYQEIIGTDELSIGLLPPPNSELNQILVMLHQANKQVDQALRLLENYTKVKE